MAAAAIAKEVFARRGVSADQLPVASPSLLPHAFSAATTAKEVFTARTKQVWQQ